MLRLKASGYGLTAAVAVVLLACSFAGAGSNPAAFLDRGVGARALGMGGAFTSVKNDPAAAYWNPAGLGTINSLKFTAMFQRLASAKWPGMEDIHPRYQFFNVTVPMEMTGLLDSGSAALSVVTMGIDNVPLTEMDETGTIVRDSFSNRETAVILSAGGPFLDRSILLGGSIRYISQNFVGIPEISASGWDFQIGQMLYLTDHLNMGVTVERGPVLVWKSGRRDVGDIRVNLGLGYEKRFTEKLKFLGAWDFRRRKNLPIQTSLGCELAFDTGPGGIEAVFARGGINRLTIENRYSYMKWLNETVKWSVGFGMKTVFGSFDLQIDYALTKAPIGSDHLVSMTTNY